MIYPDIASFGSQLAINENPDFSFFLRNTTTCKFASSSVTEMQTIISLNVPSLSGNKINRTVLKNFKTSYSRYLANAEVERLETYIVSDTLAFLCGSHIVVSLL